MPNMPERIGKYEILAEIGRGGMGAVFRAKDPVLERVVALKCMPPEVLAEEGMRDRFLREARAAARLQHVNIVTIYEFGEVEGAPFIAMELLEGEDLAEAVERGRVAELAGKIGVVAQVCDGLAYAHRHGVVHRDVKPSNVRVLPGGGVRIVDFGIAWLEGAVMATRTGQLLGTPAYMAPEQFEGKPVDHRVDIWAVGVILYELLAGRRPFAAATVPSLIYQIVHTPPRTLDAAALRLPHRLVAVIERALAKDPLQRFQELDEMARALRAARDEIATVSVGAGTAAPATGGPAEERATVSVARTPTPTALTRPLSFVEDGIFGEARRVQAMALSPDDRLLAAGGTDGSIRLWDLAARAKVETLRNREHLKSGHGSLTTCLAFSEDGAWLASGHLDGAIYLWEVASGLEIDVRMRHEGAVGGVAFPPGDELLVSGGADATVKFWELPAVRRGDPRRTMRREPDAVTCLALAGRGTLVVTGHANRNLRVHDLASGRLVATLHGQRAPLATLAVAPGGDLLASGARDGAVRVHRVTTRELVASHQEHVRAVASLAFLPGELRIASAAMDATIVVWDHAEPELPLQLRGTDEDSFAAVAVTADRRRLIAASADGRFHLWTLPR